MNLSFEWRSYLSRLGLACRPALDSLCGRAQRYPRPFTKESFFPRFKLPRSRRGRFSPFQRIVVIYYHCFSEKSRVFRYFVEKKFPTSYNRDMKNLKKLRKGANLTLQELANELELTPQVLSRYEREEHQADYNTLAKIARFFNVSIDYLLGFKAATTSAPAPALPADEKELLDLYRQLNYEGKQRLLARAEVMIEDAQQQQNKSKRHA